MEPGCNSAVPQEDIHTCLDDALDLDTPIGQPELDASVIGLGIDVLQNGWLPATFFDYHNELVDISSQVIIDFSPSASRIYWRWQNIIFIVAGAAGINIQLYILPADSANGILIFDRTTVANPENMILSQVLNGIGPVMNSDTVSYRIVIGNGAATETCSIRGYGILVPKGIQLPV